MSAYHNEADEVVCEFCRTHFRPNEALVILRGDGPRWQCPGCKANTRNLESQ